MSHAVTSVATRTLPPPPTSAAVLHFDCLYTHDLRRKHKRWQDGQLKFHTFNDKYMVYNDGGGFVGDGHWSGDLADFREGLELSLDRGAAIVQVDRCTGRTEQDLSQILDKRAREVETRRLNALSRAPAGVDRPPNPGGVVGVASHTSRTVQHRPLNTLVSNPGPIGRASLPERSPFEERNALSSDRPTGDRAPPQRSASERRGIAPPPDKEGHARKLFGTKLTLVNTSLPSRSIPPTARVNECSAPPTASTDRNLRNRVEKHQAPSSPRKICPQMTSAKPHHNRAEKPNSNDHRATSKRLRVQETDEEENEPTQMHRPAKPQQSPRAAEERGSIQTRSQTETDGQERSERKLVARIPGCETSQGDGNRSNPTVQRLNEKRQKTPAVMNNPSARIARARTREAHGMHEEENREPEEEHHELEEDIRGHGRAGEIGKPVDPEGTANAAATERSLCRPTERRMQLRSRWKPKRGLLILSELSARGPEGNGRTASGNAEPIARVKAQLSPAEEAEDSSLPGNEPEVSTGTMSPPGTKRKRRKRQGGEESGPLMKRMARKSVKSKEIFGLTLPANEPIPSPFVSLVDALRAGPGCQVGILPVRAEENSPRFQRTEREAAGDDGDADGPVLESVHPRAPAAIRPDAVPPEASAGVNDVAQSKCSVSRNEEPKSQAEPGIGGGGAWSRHAEDLLGMTRPIRKPRRR